MGLSMGGEYDAIQLKDEDGDWYAYTREDTGTPANTAIFVSAWKGIRQQQNWKGVDSGFFGSLEVVSTLGFKIFVDKLEECKSTLAWDGNPSSGWKYGPWGEDKFAQECMDKHGVLKLQ